MGKNKVIFGIGMLASLIAGLLSYTWMQGNALAQRRATETQPVVVAATDLKWGTAISKEMVKGLPFLKRTLPPGSFRDAASVEGRTLVYPVREGEPILESQLAPRTADAGGIAAVIGPRKRAMAVKVDKVIGVSGFIHPGNRVDVVATFNRLGNDSTPATKTVIENVLVLAAGPEMEKTGKGEKSAPVDVITLEVTADEGEKLALAATEGKLQLALRNQADSEEVPTQGTTVARLMSSVSLKEPAPVKARPVVRAVRATAPAPRQAPPVQYVDVIRGGAVTASKFERGQ